MAGPAVPEQAWTEIGGQGPPLVFSHANGFPPGAYRVMLEILTGSHTVATFGHRPLWSADDPADLPNWHPMAEDFGSSLANRGPTPVVGVGHSLGGVLTLLAAAQRPELFSSLILLDPVIFSGLRSFFWGWMKRLGQEHRFHLAQGAARRRDRWPDRETVRASWSRKGVFQEWDPRVFDDYLAAGVIDGPNGGVVLRYPKVWEARIFEVCPHDEWATLREIDVPVLVVRGATSDTLLPGAAARMERELPNAQVVELEETSHFLPMEKPDEVAGLIADFAAGSNDRVPGSVEPRSVPERTIDPRSR